MKIKLVLIAFVVISIQGAFAQSKNQKISFKVDGVCNMCKERIEEAALRTTGVKFADWNKLEKQLSLVYNAKKIDEKAIRTAILKTGHKVGDQPKDSTAYQSLPDCCKYEDGLEVH